YRAIWPSLAVVTRVLQQRQANARAAGTAAADKLDRLRGNRRRTEQLLQDARMKAGDRDKLLTALADERDRLERQLIQANPHWRRARELDQLGPGDLVKALPPGAVFLHFIRYTHSEYQNGKQGRTPSYMAFVLAGGRPIRRVELGEAKPIDAAVR